VKIPIISRLLERRYSLADMDRDMDLAVMGRNTATGLKITEKTALESVAVFACVRILSETLASVPLPLYKRITVRSKRRAHEHPLYTLLHDAPNPEMDSFNFREALMVHLVLWGNAYAEIDWNMNTGRPQALWPLLPNKMRVKREKGNLFYYYRLPNGTEKIFPALNIFHIPGLGFDGLIGYSPIHMAREAIGLSLATEEFGARFFGNSANPSLGLEHPGKLSTEAHDRLKKSVEEAYTGLSNQHRIMILEEGMKASKFTIPPEDAQFLETRKFQTNEIARFFRIPPHLIGDLEHATYSNIEEQSLEFVVYTMRPWFVRWEQAINRKLLWPDERKDYFAEFLAEGLLRGDVKSRYTAYSVGRQWGWLSANDVRELENMDPLPEDQGNIYYMPMNMVSAKSEQEKKNEIASLRSQRQEERSSQAAIQRHQTAQSYKRIFEDAVQRVVKRETDNVLRAAKKYLATRSSADFDAWLEDFYRDFPEFISKQVEPALYALAEAIQALAAGEVNAEAVMTPELESFLKQYASTFNGRYTKSSKGQLQALIREATEKNEEPLETITTRLSEWEEKRADKTAMNEVTQLSNAVAKVVFAGAGIIRLRWVALGSKSCPLCQELNGKVVGIDKPFLAEGDKLEAESGSEIQLYRPTTHPPLHLGCVCQIVPD
jgi:HK97 family phage portal protein